MNLSLGLKTIRARLAAGTLLTVLLVIGLSGPYLLIWVERSSTEALSQALLSEAKIISRLAEPYMGVARDRDTSKRLSSGNLARLALICAAQPTRRVTLIDSTGRVLADSKAEAAKMESHASRPEFRAAMSHGWGRSIRHSRTLNQDLLYVAFRIGRAENPVGVARVSEPLSIVEHSRSVVRRVFGAAGLVGGFLGAAIGLWLATGIAKPIRRISETADRMRKGDLTRRVLFSAKPVDEVARLAEALNDMSAELSRVISELENEKEKLEAILSKSDDAIVTVDCEQRIQMLNPAASEMLGSQRERLLGKTIVEATLSHELAELVRRVFLTGNAAELSISLLPAGREVTARVAPLDGPKPAGAVIVMRDLTELRRIDEIRRDFVANVSHEFRTPLASIRAMAETIVLRGKSDSEMVGRYAESIVKETDRLAQIAEELLDLSRIEAGRRSMRKERIDIQQVIDELLSDYGPLADEKQITVSTSGIEDIEIYTDREIICQVAGNLLDNAFRYTPERGKIAIRAVRTPDGVRIEIEDTGIGIDEDELPRIFERFYRTDRARSCHPGGTGLGLSIVKHAVEALGGVVTVQSKLGKGTIFAIHLPEREAAGQP